MPQLTDFWTGRRAVVLGMGASGVAAARHLAREGALLTVADTRETPAALATLRAELSGARFVTGGFAPELGDECDVLVLSPGLSPDFGAAAPVVARARVRGIPVIGEIELFARLLAALGESRGYHPKVVGITGTNGKTTTTVLTTEMLKASGFSAVAAGNIGLNALSALERAADEGTLPDAWVLELSSFQLETTSSLSLDGAALLNVTEDHIDWHGSMARYRAAKERIFRSARVRVLARGDDAVPRLLREGDLTFGEDQPEREGDYGLQGNELVRREAGRLVPLLSEADLLLRGRHNSLNVLAALALVRAAGGDEKAAPRLQGRSAPRGIRLLFRGRRRRGRLQGNERGRRRRGRRRPRQAG